MVTRSVHKYIVMKFHYIASQQDGRVIEGDVDSPNVQSVLSYLSTNNLKPVSVKVIEERKKEISLFEQKVTITDQIFLTKYLALMLKIGTGLLEAINILIADFKKPSIRNILYEIRSSLEQGQPFYTTFSRHPKVFSNVYTNLVKAGEASGNLEKIFQDLTLVLTKEKELRDQLKSALVYPVLLLIGAVLILVFLVMFALPKIANVFLDSGFDPPAFSKAVFAVGLFFSKFGFFIIGLAIIGIIVGIGFYKTSMFFRKFIGNLFASLPLVKTVVMKMALQRFASTLSSLIKAGMPLTEALKITADAVANQQVHDALLRISDQGLAKGLTIGEAFRREPVFPQTISNLVAISERAGHLDEVLETLSEFYAKEIDSSVKELVSFLEPALLLFIGIVIGVIALAIIVPIYQLTTQF
ncbi:type II secretion system F family protein [Candidatus Parcubacteria bacterium]|nr:MAG: type II secretion system F family protein [Candidatus Parcubacteria bacterium]